MNVLFHIEPLMFHGRPLHYAALYDIFVSLAEGLRADDGTDIRFLSNAALGQRAQPRHGLKAGDIFTVSERALSDITGCSSIGTLRSLQQGSSPAMLTGLAELYRETLGDFRPDVILSISPSPYWKTAFPSAVLLHMDGAGLFSRQPLPHVFFLDADGLFANSTLAVHAASLKALPVELSARAFVNLLQAQFRQRLLAGSPFHSLERDLRTRFRRLLLLPLQFAGEFGFDLNCGYDRQGSYLFDVLQRVAPDTAVIVTEHPTALWTGDIIDPETRAYAEQTYPNVIFAPGVREGVPYAGQFLLQHVDAVASVSSSLGMQAVFFSKPLLAIGDSHLASYATWTTVEDFNRWETLIPDHAGVVAWMMRHYYVSTEACRKRGFLASHLREIIKHSSATGLARYPLLNRDEHLLGALLQGASLDDGSLGSNTAGTRKSAA